ncbi:MAG TPA: hypothetical protein VFE47_20665 [Tepidisphaeraceae bacterium]|jgi:hypothetical protein|nr:hypothetical protein [Tepidisphaeraceae bacterium]
MADSLTYRYGRIVYAYLANSKTHKRELHPAVILSDNDEIIQPEKFDPRKSPKDNSVRAIGVSTKYKTYSTAYVRLPFSADGRTSTRLKEDCGAIIGWYHRLVIPDDAIGFGGDVPAATMQRIDDVIRKEICAKFNKEYETLSEIFDELLDD